MSTSLQVNRLRPARSEQEFALHRAALEWDLDASLSINDASDIESRRHWSERLEPFEHQIRNLITFCRRAPVALIADDVGLGKTISAGLVLSELLTRRKIRRALVICPKILLPQWTEELDSKFDVRAVHAVGTELDQLLSHQVGEVLVTTYDSARSRMPVIRGAGFDALVLDEAHKLRNLHGGNGHPPRFAVAVRAALADRVFKYVLMLTATPIKNRLWDLYSLIDCLTVAKGHRNPLGNPDEFRRRYAANAAALQINPGRRDEFRRILADYMVRTRRAEANLQFPDRRVDTLRHAATPAEARLMVETGRALAGLPGLLQVSLAQALMSSPEALLAQLGNLRTPLPHLTVLAREAVQQGTSTAKMALLLSTIKKLRAERGPSWRAVVFTTRKETQNAIGTSLVSTGINVGYIRGAQALSNAAAIKGFWREPPESNILISTDAGAEGINLQVCNVVINYDLPWDPMIVEQRIGRVQRLKSQFSHVAVLNLTVAGSVEERVVTRLLEKLQLIAHSVGDVEAILESASDDSDEGGFEARIQRLVIESLTGANVERELALASQSIDNAKRIYEGEREVVESQLGVLDRMHRTGPQMPKLMKPTPAMGVRDFVLAALGADDARFDEDANRVPRATLPGRAPFLFTFDESKALGGVGIPLRVFVEGGPDFTRLVGEWTKRAEHRVWAAAASSADTRAVAVQWCSSIPGAVLQDVRILARRASLQGRVLCRVASGVAHDRYEKLLDVERTIDSRHPRLVPGSPPAGATLEATELDIGTSWPSLGADIEAAATSDPDLAAFRSFYRERLEEELKAAAGTWHLERKARDSFEPTLAAEVVGAMALRYEELKVAVDTDIEGARYSVDLLLLPAASLVLEEPPRGTCELTGQQVPSDWLERCSVSGKIALRHLLGTSEESGRKVLRELLTVCPISGVLVLETELETSTVSGKQGRRSLFGASAVSGGRALHEELVACEVTGERVLPTELSVSAISDRKFRSDQLARSAISGTTGHVSEFVRCEATGQSLLVAESGVSDLTGRRVRADLLTPSEKPPYRRGLADEVARCSRTGKQLLMDELVTSAVSGAVADRDLAEQSACSGRWALHDELVKCEETGVALLPSESGRCCLSGRIVDARLLQRSAVSGALALERLMERCAATGQIALPAELAVCEVTKVRVLAGQLETCSLTGKRALRDRLVRSSVSGVFMLPERAVRSAASARWCAPNEVVRCQWSHAILLPEEARPCALTGLRVDLRALNTNGEIAALRGLLDGADQGTARPDIVGWLKGGGPEGPQTGARSRGGGFVGRRYGGRLCRGPRVSWHASPARRHRGQGRHDQKHPRALRPRAPNPKRLGDGARGLRPMPEVIRECAFDATSARPSGVEPTGAK